MRNLLDVWRPENLNPWREFPATDLDETDNHYLISIDIPGMTRDQLEVEIVGNTLTVSGEKREEKKEGKGHQRTYERFHGQFKRSFTLPHLAATAKVEADYKDGVLRISVPKSEETKQKARKVQIGEGKNPLFGKPQPVSEPKKEMKAGERAA